MHHIKKLFYKNQLVASWEDLNILDVTEEMVSNIQTASFYKTTSKRWNSYKYNNFEDLSLGNADWTYTSPHLIYVVDGTGHMWINKYGEAGNAKLKRFNDALIKMETQYEQNPSLANFNNLIKSAHYDMETVVGTAASFIAAIPVIYNNKHWIAITNLGDASGYLLCESTVIKLENPNHSITSARKEQELGTIISRKEQYLIQLPENNDKVYTTIILMTDGCYDTLISPTEIFNSPITSDKILRRDREWKDFIAKQDKTRDHILSKFDTYDDIADIIYTKCRKATLEIYQKINITDPDAIQLTFDDCAVVSGNFF